MRALVLRETVAGERRVAVTPESAARLAGAGFDVQVQAGAGAAAGHPDRAYADAGAQVVRDPTPTDAELLLHVRPLLPEVAATLATGTVTVGFCSPWTERRTTEHLRAAGVTALAVELVPRISRAQPMDALTSQSMAEGYRAALVAAEALPRFLGMAMTAAGTVPPASVLVLGAGVAGLQAIATAHRLGAKVSGYDVRESSAGEVRSVGGTFVDLGLPHLSGEGGYAREMSEDRAARQLAALAPHVAGADAVICCAAVPGHRAPRLVTTSMVAAMRPGSVVIDLAVASGGNVEGSRPDVPVPVEVDAGGYASVLGLAHAASGVAADSSRMYANNLATVVCDLLVAGDPPGLSVDFSDEIVAACCLTHAGEVRIGGLGTLQSDEEEGR